MNDAKKKKRGGGGSTCLKFGNGTVEKMFGAKYDVMPKIAVALQNFIYLK